MSVGSSLAADVAAELAALERELGEIDLLITQARAEAGRHEAKRAAAAERFGVLSGSGTTPAGDLLELSATLLTLTRRASVMEAQVEVLEGKRKGLARFVESLRRVRAVAEELPAAPEPGAGASGTDDAAGDEALLPPAVSRHVLSAQEDLRREIARAMHDGPAQSLTNIVLQAHIVERLVSRNPALASAEVRQLVAMVQHTLEATKSFIFDVRPMVLDDLGLVPTLRRAARDRGRRAGIAVEFDSLGADRRLPMEIESGLFRILDEALAAYLSAAPDRVWLRLDWGDQVEARIGATRGSAADLAALTASIEAGPEPTPEAPRRRGREPEPKTLPPALAAMIEDRRADRRAEADAVRTAAVVALPTEAWRAIAHRASTLGIAAEILSNGAEVRLVVDAVSAPNGDASA